MHAPVRTAFEKLAPKASTRRRFASEKFAWLKFA
jgi:hypothetical protein